MSSRRVVVAWVLACLIGAEAAAEEPAKDLRWLRMIRFDHDNDVLLGKDSSFTAAGSLQLHSPSSDVWSASSAKWIGRLPGLGDDGEGKRVVRWAVGLAMTIVTPDVIGLAEPQPDDAPWAGILGGSFSWSAYDNRRLGALQVYAGCMGPCSGAEQVHEFFHDDLGIGDPPLGWDNQLVDQALFNLNYEYRYKLFAVAPERYAAPRRFAHDLSTGARAGVGNLETAIGAQVEYRLGWGMPMGFTHLPDQPIGIMLDPVYLDPTGPPLTRVWQAYFSVVGRAASIAYMAPAEGGETVNGGHHPGLRPYPGRFQALGGFHVARGRFGAHVTYLHDFDRPAVIEESSDSLNIALEYRF